MRPARSVSMESRYLRKSFGLWQKCSTWSKSVRPRVMSSMGPGFIISWGMMWMWRAMTEVIGGEGGLAFSKAQELLSEAVMWGSIAERFLHYRRPPVRGERTGWKKRARSGRNDRVLFWTRAWGAAVLRPYAEKDCSVEAYVFEIQRLAVDAADWRGDPVGE